MTTSVRRSVSRNFVPEITLIPPLGNSKKVKSVTSFSPRTTNLPRSLRRLQLPSRLQKKPQSAPMLSLPHALAHEVATPTRPGSPGAQVVSRQRLSICGTDRQDILHHENSCESHVVEARKVVSSGTFLPQKRGASVISPYTPHPCIHLHCLCKTRMSNSSYRTCSKGTDWALTTRCGLRTPTFSAERAFIRKRGEISAWFTTIAI